MKTMPSISTPIQLGFHAHKKSVSTKKLHYRLVACRAQSFRSSDDQDSSPIEKVFKLYSASRNETLGSADEDRPPLEKAFKLYSAFQNQNFQEVAELIADESRSSNNIFPIIFLVTGGKKGFLLLLSSLLAFFWKHVEIVIQPELEHDGQGVGIRLHLAWKRIHVPLGRDCSAYISHSYTAKIFIRNLRVMFQPLIYLESLRTKLEEILNPISEKIATKLNGKRRDALMYCLLSLLSMAMTLILWKKAFL